MKGITTKLAREGGVNSRLWRQALLTIPGIGVALLPKLACPLCWPAYAGILSSFLERRDFLNTAIVRIKNPMNLIFEVIDGQPPYHVSKVADRRSVRPR